MDEMTAVKPISKSKHSQGKEDENDYSLEDSWNDAGLLIKAGKVDPYVGRPTFADELPRMPIAPELAYILVNEDELAEIDAVLYEEGMPDNVEYAKTECVYEFLEQFLLPRMRILEPLTEKEILIAAYNHVKNFKEKHPNDFRNVQGYQFLPSVGFALLQLEIHYGFGGCRGEPKQEALKLLWRASKAYRSLDLEELYVIG